MTLDTTGNLAVDTNTLYVDAANNSVGIATSTPDERLQVVGGNILLDNSRFLLFKDGAGTKRGVLSVNSGDDVVMGNATLDDIRFQTTAGTALILAKDTGDATLLGDLAVQGGDITSTGNLIIKPAGGNTTISSTLTVGTSDTTGTLLVLDTKTTAGDPTGVAGGMYYNSSTNKFRCYQNSSWVDCISSGGAGGLWTDAGDFTYLTSTTDETVIGSSTQQNAKLSVVGTSDQEQLLIKANSTQSNTNPLILTQTSTGTELFRLNSTLDGGSLYLGYQAGQGDDGTDNRNTGMGRFALDSITTGNQNTAFGSGALRGTSATVAFNSAIGHDALRGNTGSNNLAFGVQALDAGNTGNLNLAIGNNSLGSLTSGGENTALGNGALSLITSGSANVAIGRNAGSNLTGGTGNIVIGPNQNFTNATGSNQLNIAGLLTSSNYLTGNLVVGTTDTTGQLLVLDTKTDAGDPTGTNGGMYYNSSTNKFRCYQNTAWVDCISSSGPTNAFVQDGNSFGAAATLGTNDAQVLNFETGGTTKMTLDTTGNLAVDTNTLYVDAANNRVGVGIATPAATLQVGTVGATFAVDEASGSVAKIHGSTTSTTNSTNGLEVVFHNTPTAATPMVATGIRSFVQGSNANNANSTLMASVSQAVATTATSGVYGGDFTAINASSATVGAASGFNTVVSNASTGTITTARGIQVNSASNSAGGTIANNYGIYVDSQTAGTNDYGIYIAGADTSSLWVNSGNSYFGGNVGIGATTPATRLQVSGDIRVGTSGTNGCVQRFDGTGIAGTCSSDSRLKANVQGISGALAGITDTDFVSFNWNDVAKETYQNDPSVLNYGVIAQNIEKAFPNLVSTDDKGYKKVDYQALGIMGLSATKELGLKVEGQEQAIRDLRNDVDRLKLVAGLDEVSSARLTGKLGIAMLGGLSLVGLAAFIYLVRQNMSLKKMIVSQNQENKSRTRK